MPETLDYNLAYYRLTQERANQLATDQKRYSFVEFDYQNKLVENIFKEIDIATIGDGEILLKIEINNVSGNVFIVNKEFYPETLYDYVTFVLDDPFYNFYLENKYNPKYADIDLRVLWYFTALDKSSDFYIKKVRNTKYIFSYKRLCEHYDYDKKRSEIKICCKNVGLLKKGEMYLCPNHFRS